VKLGNVEAGKQLASASDSSDDGSKLGLALRPLTGAERQEAHVDHGLVVEDVDGPAARAGIQSGDVLLAVNGKPVGSVDDVKSILAAKPKRVALLIWRDGSRIFFPVNLG
jgi:serine protease Do